MIRAAFVTLLALVAFHRATLVDASWQAPSRVDFGPQDPVALDKDHYTVELENEHVRVVRVRYGAKEPGILHEHRCGRLNVYLSPLHSSVKRDATGETTEIRARTGEVRWGVPDKHSDLNLDNAPIELVYVEVKSACGAR